jgi:hypothetical protein
MSNDRRQIVEALTEERAGLVCLASLPCVFHLCSTVVWLIVWHVFKVCGYIVHVRCVFCLVSVV